jgi:adenylate cyclase
MPKINCLPDNRSIEINKSDTVLESLLANGIDHTHVCGGNAYCSTCRIMILNGVQNCSSPTSAERALAKKLDFPVHIRLACQTKVTGNVAIRRMIIDNEDIDILEGQLATGADNSDRNVALLVATIRGATNFDEVNFHYDIVYIMSRYFHRVQKVIGKHGGIIPNIMGVRIMAVFGFEKNSSMVAERAVWAGLEMLKTIEDLNIFLKKLSYHPLHLSIGIHYGEAVLVSVDSSKPNMFTPLGDVANSVGHIESVNQELGSNLLVSESIYNQVKDKVIINRNGNLSLATTKFKVYEVTGMQGSPPKFVKVEEALVPAPKRFMSFIQKLVFPK